MKLLGISGKAGSGKTTWSNYLLGVYIKALGISDAFYVSDEGWLVLDKLVGYDADLPMSVTADELFWEGAESDLSEHVAPYFKVYNFAEALKRKACVDILGLDKKQCYGNQDDKNTDTRYNISNFRKFLHGASKEKFKGPDRPLTAREVMELVGTDIFRQIYNDVWVDACIRKIAFEDPQVAIVNDVRFLNEVEAIKACGGIVIRLTRQVEDNKHQSDNDLDDYKNFDLVIDNQSNEKLDTANVLYPFLEERGFFSLENLEVEV